MFEKITPEEAGVSSNNIVKLISIMEKHGAATHGFLMMKGGKIFAEAYWKPFHQDFCHRMYSQTKSFVGIAIGLLQEEGKLNINDKIVDYFFDKIDGELPMFLEDQTIRDMLTMSTIGTSSYWFNENDLDRTHLYLNDINARNGRIRPSGTLWEYDSAGTQVLSSLVEKLSGKKLLAYMKEKLFNKMGTFQTARMLETRNGDSWGDSGMICTLRDMASFGLLLMNDGLWEGEQLISADYVREATSRQVDNREDAHYSVIRHGYGYQIWCTEHNGFSFQGMGHQMTYCYPDKQLLFTYVSDNQGTSNAALREIVGAAFQDLILQEIKDVSISKNISAQKRCERIIRNLKLRAVKGQEDSPFREEISGVKYICQENAMGIKEFSFRFTNEKRGIFYYTNKQGKKKIPFGVNFNVFGKFPEMGYSNERGGVNTSNGFMYDDAVSIAWAEDKKLILFVQVIDSYFGNMSAVFSFKNDMVVAHFSKNAQNFMNEYYGILIATKKVKKIDR